MNILSFVLKQLKFFFLNPFWKKWPNLVIIIISSVINGYIWYIYLRRLSEFVNITPVYFAFGCLILNIFLAVIAFPKEKILSNILISTGLLVQIIIIFFLSITLTSGGF